MQQKQVVAQKLRAILEDGYKKREEQDIFQVQRVPRSGEPGFDSDCFRKYLKFGANGSQPYRDYTNSIKDIFEDFGLSFARFRNNTESINPKTDADSPAGLFVRQLQELDKIVNDESYFTSYILPTAHGEVMFKDGVIAQDYKQHKFRHDKHRDLLDLL